MAYEVSIIVAAYNVANYIEKAIASALSQEDISIEIIIVDDASTDNTWNVISAIRDARVKVYRNNFNQGPSATRNLAISFATKNWIAVLDGDDEFLPFRLDRCIQHAQKMKADIVVDNIQIYREQDKKTYPMFKPSKFRKRQYIDLISFIGGNQHFLGGHEILGYLKPIFSTAFLRSHSLSYDPDIRIGEDYILLAECLAAGALCVVEPEVGYRYTIRKGSISHRLTLEDIDRIIAGDQRFLKSHLLSNKEAECQKKRYKNLLLARDYTLMVTSIKLLEIKTVTNLVCKSPLSALLLWKPLQVRIRKLVKKVFA